MKWNRRDFLKTSSVAAGAAAIGAADLLPGWLLDLEAAEAAAVDKAKLADIALATAKAAGASYADIRINRYRNEFVSTREKQVQSVSRGQSFGFGVRVLVRGAWGFGSSNKINANEVRRVAQQAAEIAAANATFQRKPIQLVPATKAVANWRSKIEKDPFDVPIEDKISFLLKLNERALQVKGANYINSSVSFANEQKYFASSEGSRIEHYIIRSFPQFNVTAVGMRGGSVDFQTRRSLRGPQQMGYEFIEKEPWLAEAEQAGNEAVEKLKAKSVEPGKYDLVLHPTHLWLTIHESAGHSTELDRALGWEADYAGTSFLTPDQLGKFQFGSKLVNIFADRTQPAGLATVGYDDDGVQTGTWYLVKDGVFVGWQTTRELAGLVGEKTSNGCCHADSWGSVPFPRMPNVSLDPGHSKATLDDLLADVKNGILIYGDGSWSIDQQRYNFQFGGQVGWEIKDGKKGAMLRDVAYQSRTPDFWGACDGIGGYTTYELNGAFNDGKGEPGQSNAVSHGCPVARFRQISVLNTARS